MSNSDTYLHDSDRHLQVYCLEMHSGFYIELLNRVETS